MTREKRTINSYELDIRLDSGKESELFKWFLACLLFGKPIQQEVTKRTYYEFMQDGLNTPEAILAAGWDHLVFILDQGHYVRYDYSTATKLLDVCQTLKDRYGSIMQMIREAKDEYDLAASLQQFKGIGPVTADIFLRDIDFEFWKNIVEKRLQ